MFPTESYVNTSFRKGATFAANRNGSDMGAYQSNDYTIPSMYYQPNNTVEKGTYAKDFVLKTVEEHPHQLWAGEKIDGELIDSWRSFKSNNSIEVNGIYGPINAIKVFKDRLYFYQNAALGVASIDERSVVQDDSGQSLVLGTGGVFPNYSYVSENTKEVYINMELLLQKNGLYHYDARLRKVFRLNSNGLIPISDTKRVSSLFYNLTNTLVNNIDKTLSTIEKGSTSTYGL